MSVLISVCWQELLALVDTASSSLAVLVQSPAVPPLAAENETATKEDVFNDPDCLSKRPLTPLGANQTGPSLAPPMAPGLSSSNARTVNAEAAQAHALPCDDHRYKRHVEGRVFLSGKDWGEETECVCVP
jgi:hypothetical protein